MNNLFREALTQTFTESQVLTDRGECLAYGYDSTKQIVIPIAVVFTTNEAQVITLVELCNQHRVPITARGKGSGMVGACVPLENGIVVSFERMNRVLHIDTVNRYMIVEPGITNADVQRAAAKHGFFLGT